MQKDYVYYNWRCWFGWAKSDVRCGDHADQPRRIIGPILEDARVYVLCLWLFWNTVVFWYRPVFITSHPWQISIKMVHVKPDCPDIHHSGGRDICWCHKSVSDCELEKKGLPPQRRFGKSLEQLTWKRHGRRKEDHPESDIRVTSTNFQVVCILCYEARFNVKRGLTWREVWREGRFNAGMNPLNFHLLLSSRRHIAIRNPRDNIPQALKT